VSGALPFRLFAAVLSLAGVRIIHIRGHVPKTAAGALPAAVMLFVGGVSLEKRIQDIWGEKVTSPPFTA
jgi:uncharacterized membrane protein YjjP (DUF1212 family)